MAENEKIYKITEESENDKVSIELTESEVKAAIEVCNRHAIKKVIIMKKHKGSAAYYINIGSAEHAMERNHFPAYFQIEKTKLISLISKKS